VRAARAASSSPQHVPQGSPVTPTNDRELDFSDIVNQLGTFKDRGPRPPRRTHLHGSSQRDSIYRDGQGPNEAPTTITQAVAPFSQILKSLDPNSVFEWSEKRVQYCALNQRAVLTGHISGLFSNLDPSIQTTLTTNYPDVANTPGNGILNGDGWHFMTDDFIVTKLFKLRRPRTAPDFLEYLEDFMAANLPKLPEGHLDLFAPQIFDTVITETQRVFLLLQRFYVQLKKATADDASLEPNPNTQFEDKYNVSSTGIKQKALMYQIVLRMLAPLLAKFLTETLTHDVLKRLKISELITKVVQTLTRFNDQFQTLRPGIAHIQAGQVAHEAWLTKPLTRSLTPQLVNHLSPEPSTDIHT